MFLPIVLFVGQFKWFPLRQKRKKKKCGCNGIRMVLLQVIIPHLYVFIPILGMFSSSTLYTNTTVVCTNIAHIWTEVMI